MGQKNSRRDEVWAHAKKVCGLDERHIEMAKKLGMNPRKLPHLRPSPSQRWKLPVAAFIEECYAKRFKGEQMERVPEANGSTLPKKRGFDPSEAACFLSCHLANIQMDLEAALASGHVERELLWGIARDLQRTAREIEAGEIVSQMPYSDFGEDSGR